MISSYLKAINMCYKILAVLIGIFAVGSALPQLSKEVPIVSQSNEINPDGSFQWSYESGDGSAQQQSGQLKGSGKEAGEAMQGQVSWKDPTGGAHQLTYVADENGYQPAGADLPIAPEPPAIPAAIARALEWIAAHPSAESKVLRK
ncbi:larval cuticle protein 65Ab1-like [Anthonomus grandis grandis]|uniref:larval cuticle protein 65Ab1-like n=1 Tax=Anthonomus grandis grandis TaxID=2921223 RepID=UPI0021665BAB|nr:larval cuticle protein 65Ab1-like [Anthonomus grandis grandis]